MTPKQRARDLIARIFLNPSQFDETEIEEIAETYEAAWREGRDAAAKLTVRYQECGYTVTDTIIAITALEPPSEVRARLSKKEG